MLKLVEKIYNQYLQHLQDPTSSVSFETWSFNNSFPEEEDFLKLSRDSENENSNISQSTESTCSSHVSLLRGFRRKRKGFSFCFKIF